LPTNITSVEGQSAPSSRATLPPPSETNKVTISKEANTRPITAPARGAETGVRGDRHGQDFRFYGVAARDKTNHRMFHIQSAASSMSTVNIAGCCFGWVFLILSAVISLKAAFPYVPGRDFPISTFVGTTVIRCSIARHE